MDRWLIPIVAAVVALALGFGLGALVYADDDAEPATADPGVAATPDATAAPVDETDRQTCLAALESAEQDVQAEQRLADLMNDYESVIERSTEALSELDTRRLEQLLTEVEELNIRSKSVIDDSREADVGAAIDTCRTVLGADDV